MVYSLELFETFTDPIYIFLTIINLDTYIHNLHENLRMTKRTPIMLLCQVVGVQLECKFHVFIHILILLSYATRLTNA
jgi:hypothetical protein